jgi:hypothetical protein
LAVAVPCTVSAGDANCLWGKIPGVGKTEIIAAYEKAGSEALTREMGRWAPSPKVMMSCMTKPVTKESVGTMAEAAGAASKGIALQQATEALLSKRFAMSPSTVDKAWRDLPGFDKRSLEKSAVTNTPSADANKAVLDAMRLALPNLTAIALLNDPRRPHLEKYFVGRALRSFNEPLF